MRSAYQNENVQITKDSDIKRIILSKGKSLKWTCLPENAPRRKKALALQVMPLAS